MYRGRSSQIGVIKEKCYGSELSKYEGIETKERFRYAPGVERVHTVALMILGTEK